MTEAQEWMHLNSTHSSTELIDCMGSDKTVVHSARVSYANDDPLNSMLNNKDEKLINYLAEHKHMSPFNHCFATFKCEAPIFVARQLVKHEYLIWNEISRRYTEKDLMVFRVHAWGEQSENNKQGTGEPLKESLQYMCTEAYENAMFTAFNCYKALLRTGVSKEDARMVLPLSTMTQWYWSGSLGAFAKMCKLRMDNHSQHYTRYLAEDISFLLKSKFPVSWEALMNK
tara:strand:- start:12376 stop:13059 length:684 start_codon:yes stop_codon:yes gene_type:complete